MSKNVAVFVDVANIFYAAKAAGVDIDYVTLLKSSVAGRDFVRAYAYTGLDPENENQRQFHSFLARNGYKVVSKDIRKYGDGRIKANLDIELVVDMMRMAQHLDIAVVVSGDGDFAPAIRAVQQMGVRVEVVSFRGNTSSDLIEVADAFTDIAQIARVDKGSARSGRRVAAEGDLSMTEVPEKETEGAPRRRRARGGRAVEQEPAVAAVASGAETAGVPANLIVLPGERLSRAPEEEAEAAAGDEVEPLDEEEMEEADAEAADDTSADGRRRRRRRGGRGRGRGRRDTLEQPAVAAGADLEAAGDEEEDEDEFAAAGPAQLPHHTFGSVWDTQLGVPTVPMATGTPITTADDEEDYEDEPEIPEYLLAERRQRGQQRGGRGRMAGRGRGAGYQAAVERERYGRGGASAFGGGGAPRLPERPRGDRPRQGRPQGRPPRQEGRPPREQRAQDRPVASSGQPWSEVPPEVEELLRAELARQAPARVDRTREPSPAPAESESSTAAATVSDTVDAEQARPKAPSRRRTAAPKDAKPETAEEAPAKPARAPRRRATAAPDEQAGDAAVEEPAKPKRTPRTRKAAEASADAAPAEEADVAPAKPARRRRTKAEATADDGGQGDSGEA